MSNRQVLSTETKSSIPSWLRTPQVVWIVGDLIAAVPSFYLALFIRFGGDLAEAATSVGDIVPRAFLFASLIIAGLFATGMYRTRQRILPMQILTHTAVSVVIGGLLNILVFYIHPPVSTGRGVLLFALCIALFSITLMRRLMAPFTERFVRRRRIVVVGGGRAAQKIAMRRRRADQRRYEVVAYLETTGDLNVYHGAALEHTVSKIDDLYDTEFDEVVLALDERRGAIDSEILFNLRQRGVSVITLVDFLEREAGRVDIDVADPAWFVFTQGCHARPHYLQLKRVVDILGAFALLLVFAPVFVIIVLALGLESRFRSPFLYRQERVGLRGDTFELLKFRSMRQDAEIDGPQWSTKDDNRITLVGRLIRRLRLDELPQLINILRGEMSIVGPRPERPEFIRELSQKIPMYEYRHLVKPGLAGWAQLSFPYGESENDAREKLKYDLYYIKNASFVLDFFILAQTLEVVIWGESVSMSGRNIAFDSDLPSARLPNWQPHRRTATSERVHVIK